VHGTNCEHQDRPDDSCSGAINLHSGKLTQSEHHVARNENGIRAYGGELRHVAPWRGVPRQNLVRGKNSAIPVANA
jgi:hypothetical protein